MLYAFVDPNSNNVPQQLVIEWDQVANQGAEAAGFNDDATFELILQINTGATPGSISSLLFPYFLIPSGLANLWGFQPIAAVATHPAIDVYIVLGACLLAAAALGCWPGMG